MKKTLGEVLLILFIGLVFLLASSVVSCSAVEVIDPLEIYEDKIWPILEEYKSIVNDWEEVANDSSRLPYLDLDAENAYSRMETLIAAWDALIPPDNAQEYHLWMRNAMNYEKEAFGIMADYYRLGPYSDPKEFGRLRGLATQMWILKDEALLRADAAYPR